MNTKLDPAVSRRRFLASASVADAMSRLTQLVQEGFVKISES